MAEMQQASQLARLLQILSFVVVYAMLYRKKNLLAVLLQESHHIVADIGFLCEHVFCNFIAIKQCIMTEHHFGTQ